MFVSQHSGTTTLTLRRQFPAIWLAILLLLSSGLHVSNARAVTEQQISSELEKVERSEQIAEPRKTSLKERLTGMQSKLSEIEKLRSQSAEFIKELERLPEQTREVQTEIKRLERSGPGLPGIDAGGSVEEVGRSVTRVSNLRKQYEAELEALDGRITAEQQRPRAIRLELEALNAALGKEPDVTLIVDEGAGESSLDTRLNSWAAEIDKTLAEVRRKTLENELVSSPIRLEWLKTQRELKSTQLDRVVAELRQLEFQMQRLRTADVEKVRDQARAIQRELGITNRFVRTFARENIKLGDLLAETTAGYAQVADEVATVSARLDKLSENFDRTRQKIEVAGLSQALGQVLLEERRRLAGIGYVPEEVTSSEETIATIGLRQIQHEEAAQALKNPEVFVEELLAEAEDPTLARYRGELQVLSEKRSELLEKLIAAEQDYLQIVGDLDFARRQLQSKAEAYRTFITERLLWIRSDPPLSLSALQDIPRQALQIINIVHVRVLYSDIGRVLRENIVLFGVLVLALALFVRERDRLRVGLRDAAVALRRLTTDNFGATVRAVLITVLLALPFPLALILTGLALYETDGLGRLGQALAPTFALTGRYLLFIQLLRQLGKPDGVFRNHFKWKENMVSRLNRTLFNLMWVFLPSLALTTFFINFDYAPVTGALTHLALATSLFLLSAALTRSFDHAARLAVLRDDTEGVGLKANSYRAMRIIFIVVPVSLALLGLFGYVYSAATLATRLLDSLCLLSLLVLIYQLVLRWLTLAQRKLAYQEALDRRAALKQKAKEQAEGTSGEPQVVEAAFEPEDPRIDIEAVGRGARELLSTVVVLLGAVGLWVIWSDILPAFGILDDYALWEYTETGGEGETRVPVTLFDLGVGIFIVTLTVLAAKRVPALLEFILLQRLSLSAGGLYTVRTLSAYIIVAIGIVSAFSSIGASWSQIQWLAAALSVGIGFGLQEIVANFISGLIILFERPIRVGDVVTVGDTDGTVTRINIRATTIRNWDQKELLVPNKEFITGRLLNWTLSDQVTRIFIPIGIAYGSDVDLAIKVLQEIVDQHPNVTDEPPPSVLFEALGDNALILNVRAFVNRLEYRLPVINELHTSIYKRLAEAGIVIAFPQRDIHLDTSKPLEIRLTRDAEPAESPG